MGCLNNFGQQTSASNDVNMAVLITSRAANLSCNKKKLS